MPGKIQGQSNRNRMPPRGGMSVPERRMLLSFGESTFTLEIENSPTRKLLIEAGLIEKHPGGPFGSRCSYYRTQEGLAEWTKLKKEQDNAKL